MARRERPRERSAGRRAAAARAEARERASAAGVTDPAAPGAQPAAPRPQEDTPEGPAERRWGEGWTELLRHPLIRAGFYSWAVVGVLACAVVLFYVVAQLRLVVVPVLLALFPAALLVPLTRRLRAQGMPGALAALLVLLGGVALLVAIGQFIVNRVIAEWPELVASIGEGWQQFQDFLATGPFGLDPTWIQDGIAALQEQVADADIIRTGVLGVATAVAEIIAMLVLLLVVLFFYLKDGSRIAGWVRDLFPRTVRQDVQEMGSRAWTTIAAYIRGQLLIALVDGVFIGIGLWILGVPLALPLGVLVFFGGLFPIVGAVVTGAIAVLVALADGGPLIALIALGIVVAVQQLESNVLAPMVLGKATALHPLGVLTSLTAGGILLGVLGAFIAVPIAASITRAIGYLRQRAAPEG